MLRFLCPQWVFDNYEAVTPEFLKEHGVKVIRTNKLEQPAPNLMDLILDIRLMWLSIFHHRVLITRKMVS